MAWLQVSISIKKLNYVVFRFFCIQLFPTFFMVQVFQGPITLKHVKIKLSHNINDTKEKRNRDIRPFLPAKEIDNAQKAED